KAASRDSSACGVEVRRVEPAGLSDYGQGRGAEREHAARHGAVRRAQPGGERARRFGAAAVRWAVPSDYDLRRPAEAGGAPDERDGRGEGGQRREPDIAGGGCEGGD